LEVNESKSEEGSQLGGFSGERWTPERDIQAFASILFELMFGSPPTGEGSIPTGIPSFVLNEYPTSETRYSFDDIFKILKQANVQIGDGVDSAEVSAFVWWVESAEQPKEETKSASFSSCHPSEVRSSDYV
jgi:hypothetical protein